MKNEKITIHTDGSCLGNPGPGGWGVVIHFQNKEITLSGGAEDTTNNRMEMMAIIEALKWATFKSGLTQEELHKVDIELFSDSNLLMQSLTLGWKRKANLDLWAKLDTLRGWLKIKWVWVKAHANNKYNNLADELALAASKKIQKLL
jgi:ribonuclease HI